MFDQSKIIFSAAINKQLLKRMETARMSGDIGIMKQAQALLAISKGVSIFQVAQVLCRSIKSIQNWLKAFVLDGVKSLQRKKSPGRPSKLTPSQKKKLGEMIDAGPEECGYSGACWRSPLIQDLIYREFGKFYSVKYIAELLKNMNFSYQKAKFVSDHLDQKKRQEWLDKTWPEILKLSNQKNARIMFGDEVSFPMWGSLSYTWSRKGSQPVVKTSGKRKGHKVFGLICYNDGAFYSEGIEGRFNSASYISFLKGVLAKNKKHIILIQDGARYHTSKETSTFFQKNKDQITVFRLPSYSPDYNPIEKLWKKVKQSHIHLHYFPTFEDLKEKVQEALIKYKDLQEEVLALFGFYRNLDKIYL